MEKVGKYKLHYYFCRMTTQKKDSKVEGKIYILIDPITNKIRYVGLTKLSLEQRLYNHLHDLKAITYKTNWIKSLKKENKIPIIKQIDSAYDIKSLEKKEVYWIKYYLSKGVKLTNYILTYSTRPYKFLNKKTSKKVIQYDLQGKKIAEYSSAGEAACKLGACSQNSTIYTICNGSGKKYTFKGFVFRYEGDSFNKYKIVGRGIHKTSEKHKKYLSEKAKERNKKFTREHYVKASSMIKNRKGTPKKPVIEIKSNILFDSITTASKKTGVSKTVISDHCNKKIKKKPLFMFKDIVHS